MDWLFELRPIRFFSLYLALMFIASTWRRFTQYRAILGLAVGLKNRWPNLTRLILSYRHILVTWGTVGPLIVSLVLLTANTVASQFVWPRADLFRLGDLAETWPALLVVLVTAVPMVAFDTWGVVRVGQVDRAETEKYFDQAEMWLTGWRAPAVRALSLGYVNPRQIVDREVRQALESAVGWLSSTLRWVSTQAALRIAFGLSLWASWALHGLLLDWLKGPA